MKGKPMDDLLDKREAEDEWNTINMPDEYIVLKGKAALIAKILLELSERRTE